MKRRTFINRSLYATVGLSLGISKSAFSFAPAISDEALTGQENLSFQNSGIKLHKEAFNAFLKMKDAAATKGIHISAVSAFRSFDHQKRIWDRKYLANLNSGLSPIASIKKIVEYSTMPGTSRHHWGTDVDIIDANVPAPASLLNPKNFGGDGVYKDLKDWMDLHANKFGFYLVYTDHPERKGFKYEPWHYSYRPLSCEYLRLYRERNLFEKIKNSKIEGSEHFTKDFLEQYYQQNILDINSELL